MAKILRSLADGQPARAEFRTAAALRHDDEEPGLEQGEGWRVRESGPYPVRVHRLRYDGPGRSSSVSAENHALITFQMPLDSDTAVRSRPHREPGLCLA